MAEPKADKPLKGILKASSQSFTPPSSNSSARRLPELNQEEISEILRLQQGIFDDSMLFIDFPRDKAPEFTAAHPSPADAAEFTKKIIEFKPDDYDGLVQERNAEKKCGYVLCGNKNRTYNRGQMVLVDKNRAGFAVMKGEEMSKWCSDACMRRALYIKVQLQEVLRTTIELMDEEDVKGPSSKAAPSAEKSAKSAQALKESKAADEAKKQEDMAALAQERGPPRRVGRGDTVSLTIREKKVKIAPTAPVSSGHNDHMNIEGHPTKSGTATDRGESTSEEDVPALTYDEVLESDAAVS